jgi:hypothetical protein
MAEPTPTPGWEWAAVLSAAVTAFGLALRVILRARLPARRAGPDPLAGFDRLTARMDREMERLSEENVAMRDQLERQEAECQARLAALERRVARLVALLARAGLVEEAGP